MIADITRTTARAAFGAAALAVAACASPRTTPPPLPFADDLDARILESLDRLDTVQGLSVAVYTPDGVYTQGFGVTDMETSERVTADTAFYIASSTKSFVALAMSLLDARGEIDLDDSIAEFAPDATFPPSIDAGAVTLRDLLTHTSGIENNPLVFRVAFTGEHDPETLWRLLGDSEPNEDAPHGAFDYTNVGYNILTVLTDHKLQMRWQDLLQQEIFDRAKMARTSAYMSAAERGGWSLARPHGTLGPGAPYRIRLEKADATMQSAGGMIMSAADAATWLSVMINDGRVDGEQVFPAAAVRATRAPLAEVGGSFGGYSRDQYGLGWYLGDYRDEPMVHHFGGFAGARAHISYLPARKVGVAAFVNDSSAGFELPDVIANYVYDRILEKVDADEKFEAALDRLTDRRDQANAAIAADREKRSKRQWTLSQDRAAYAGAYENNLYGVFHVTSDGDNLVFRIGNLMAVAEPFTAPDTARVELIPDRGEVIGFKIGDDGAVEALGYSGEIFLRR